MTTACGVFFINVMCDYGNYQYTFYVQKEDENAVQSMQNQTKNPQFFASQIYYVVLQTACNFIHDKTKCLKFYFEMFRKCTDSSIIADRIRADWCGEFFVHEEWSVL